MSCLQKPTLSIHAAIMSQCDEIEDAEQTFKELFPSEGEGQLTMGHFIEVYKILDRIHNNTSTDE